ncbi:hypothetical protein HYW99_02005 [Candidatus Woesearchaeota archaeon]|nr:hypothetical protein [Candidatus Woesearchaeota archaeon]
MGRSAYPFPKWGPGESFGGSLVERLVDPVYIAFESNEFEHYECFPLAMWVIGKDPRSKFGFDVGYRDYQSITSTSSSPKSLYLRLDEVLEALIKELDDRIRKYALKLAMLAKNTEVGVMGCPPPFL